ncbi:hypothetical protein IQ07DRAFT_640782 [Pyrenochaeta sp. DS3sAY3a]|nr:hypothetical protein IQ07DRAFT_640782 [Pyrenochaeta sp. DS3sAY3a]
MDVYTEPEASTHEPPWKPFMFPSENGDVWAVSIPSPTALALLAVFAVMVTYTFNALWNVFLHGVMLSTKRHKGVAYNLILTVFWNSAEPASASSNLFLHLWRMIFQSGFKFTDESQILGWILTALALLTALASIAGSILIPARLVLGNVAPVNPRAVWIPGIPELGNLSPQYSMLFSANAVRAVGSAEASKITLRNKVFVSRPETTEKSTPEQPDFSIDYNYNLTGVELGMRNELGFVHSVKGKCWTEYSWLKHVENTTRDYYDIWNLDMPNYFWFVEADNATGIWSKLDLMAAIHPDQVEKTPQNVSYALLYNTAHIATFTETSDPMYMTERLPEDEEGGSTFPFRVKAGRPALSCWQDSTMCIRGDCGEAGALLEKDKNFPPGLMIILSRMTVPMILDVAQGIGASALMSYYSPLPGTIVDAASSKTIDDLERMILGSYLLSRNLLRDTTMMKPFSGFSNAVRTGKDEVLPGTGDFVLETKAMTAMSMMVLILVPSIMVFFTLLAAIGSAFARYDPENTQTLRWQRERMVNLSNPSLYRVASEKHGYEEVEWKYKSRLHPVPTREDQDVADAFLGGQRFEDKDFSTT